MVLSTGCSAPATFEPTPPTADFRPKVELVVDGTGIRAEPGEREDPQVTLEPLEVGAGTVARVENRGEDAHRVQATAVEGGAIAFDTGTLRAGESALVVLDNTTASTKVLEVRDLTAEGSAPVVLTIRPRAAT